MPDTVQILHNPRCSKSRQTLALLRARGIEPEIIEYLKNPPSTDRLLRIAQMLSRPLDACLRHKEDDYQAVVANQCLSEQALAEAVCQHPKLLERPIVIHGQRAAIGRPPEDVLALFEFE